MSLDDNKLNEQKKEWNKYQSILDMVGSVIAVFVLLSHNELYLTFICTHLHN